MILNLCINKIFNDHNDDNDYRGIVFVEEKASCIPLAYLINNMHTKHDNIRTGAIHGGMQDSEREAQMTRFSTGKTTVIVATKCLQEGIDESNCAFVIRFDKFTTIKDHIQGKGRARRPNASIFYFENDPAQEQAG